MEVWLFIAGYLLQLIGSCLLLWKIWRKRSVYGLSTDTQLCLLISTISRCVWALDTRLTETGVVYIELLCSILAALMLCFQMFSLRHTTTKQATLPLRAYVLAPAALVLAVIFHPGNHFISVQILVAFTMYLEAVALLPQLYLMRHMLEVEPLTSHYVALLILSRIIRLIFWAMLFLQGEHFLGLLFADVFHTLLAADYLHLWIRKLRSGALIFQI